MTSISIFGIVYIIHNFYNIIHGHCITIFVWPTRIIGSAGVYTFLCIHLLLLLHILKLIFGSILIIDPGLIDKDPLSVAVSKVHKLSPAFIGISLLLLVRIYFHLCYI